MKKILILILLFFSCVNSKSEVQYINKDNYKTWLKDIRNFATSNYDYINALDEFITINNHEIYGVELKQYLLDKAVIGLCAGKFYNSYKLLKSYLKQYNDLIMPYYFIGTRLIKINSFSGQKILELSLINAKGDIQNFDSEKQNILFGYLKDKLFLFFKTEDLDPSVSGSSMFQFYSDIYKDAEQVYLENSSEFIFLMGGVEYFDKEFIWGIEKKKDITVEEIDFLIAWYISPYTFNIEKALFWAEKRGFNIERENDEYFVVASSVLQNMMTVYIFASKYDKALQLFEKNKEKIDDLRRSQRHIYLLLSVIYAGQGDVERSLFYLKKEFEVTAIQIDPVYPLTDISSGDYPKGDMLYSLFQLVFIFDEFNIIEKAGRQDELDRIVNEGLERYKDLEIFFPDKVDN